MKTFKQNISIRVNRLNMLILGIMMVLSLQSNAQSSGKNSLLQMIEDDRTTIDVIAGYDKKIQSHILQVAQTPELLNKIEELQKRSQNEFKAIIENYDRDTQSAFYEMARYPNLITDLVANGKPSGSEIGRIVSNYPQEIHQTTKNYAGKYFDVLQSIDRLNNEIDRAFKYALEPYSPQTRESVNVLIAYPEIVSALVDDKSFTILLGEIYRDDPDWVNQHLDQISQELAERNKDDLNAYKNQIQSDPEAYKEMLEAADEFAMENNEVRSLNNPSDPILDVRVINSYPYWFGYPYWYSEPYWRPRPYYYHTGFYRNNFGNVVFTGLPSYYFMHWQSYYHPTLFPHLSYNYYSYYENHYMRQYRESPRTFPRQGFYRSIEANVINNPRVNNSTLQRIDHQRGNNIVRQPNTMESRSYKRGNSVISRQGATSGSRQFSTKRGSLNERGSATGNSGTSGQEGNRRAYNSVNHGRSEGSYNRRGSESGNGSIRRNYTPGNSSIRGSSSGRSRQGTSMNQINSESPRSNGSGYGRTRENAPQLTARQRTSSYNEGSRVAEQQRAVTNQQRRETASPASQPGRVTSRGEAYRTERSSVSAKRETPSATARASARSDRREASSNKTKQPANRRMTAEKGSNKMFN